MAYILLEEVYPWYFKVGFLGNIFITLASITSFIVYRKYFPTFISTSYILLILFVALASFSDFGEFSKRPTFYYSLKGIGTFVNFGILFFAADTVYFPKVLKLFYYLCFVIIIAGIINLGKVGLGAGRKEFLLVIRDFTVFLIWVFPFFFLLMLPEEIKIKNK